MAILSLLLMAEQRSSKSITLTLLVLILLADIGLVVWGWYLYQSGQAQYSAAGLNVSKVPPGKNEAVPSLRQQVPQESLKPTHMLLQQTAPEPKSRKMAPAPSARADSHAPIRATPRTKQLLDQATERYFSLKKEPRFKNSKVIREWTKDFLRYPDLRQINARYHQDKDAMRFIADTLRSPNFSKMLRKYFQTPDIQSFFKDMSSSPEVISSAGIFLSIPEVSSLKQIIGLGHKAPNQQQAIPKK